MPNDEIEPALTPDEWADQRAHGYGDWVPNDRAVAHKLAALCLHGQPFGFTHEDLAIARSAAAYAESAYEDPTSPLYDDGGAYEHMLNARRLAKKIAALLPPEA